MKIIEAPTKWSLERRCWGITSNGCYAHLEIDIDDLKVQPRKDSLSRELYYDFYFECPCCSGINEISKEDIPEYIQRNAVISYNKKNNEKKEQQKLEKKI